MTKPRKLHQLSGTIKHCFLGTVTSKSQFKNNPFYYLEINTQSLFIKNQKEIIYAFPNLVSPEIWKTLEQRTFENKTYFFWCEKRTRGWRLKNMEQISQQN